MILILLYTFIWLLFTMLHKIVVLSLTKAVKYGFVWVFSNTLFK